MNNCLIIAEAGVNHNGDILLAKRLIEEAKACGADIIKFQSFKTEQLVSKHAKKAEYQMQNTKNTDSQYMMLKKLELSYEDHLELITYCKELGIQFLSTAFDLDSIDMLSSFSPALWKIPSGEITNLPYLEKIAKKDAPIILSTGMSTLEEIQDAVSTIRKYHTNSLTLLHCTTEYPAPFHTVNLNAMQTIRNTFQLPVGYSDHTVGIEVPIAAVALGATVIEKHFTLDKSMNGPDHKASLEPGELKAMVSAIRAIEQALGSPIKAPSEVELKNCLVARKSLIAKKKITAGERFTEDNITCKRPGNGISPMRFPEFMNKYATRDYEEDELIIDE